MTHPYIYQHGIERRAEDIRWAEQHRLALLVAPENGEPSVTGSPTPEGGEPSLWNHLTWLFAGWLFRPQPIAPTRGE